MKVRAIVVDHCSSVTDAKPLRTWGHGSRVVDEYVDRSVPEGRLYELCRPLGTRQVHTYMDHLARIAKGAQFRSTTDAMQRPRRRPRSRAAARQQGRCPCWPRSRPPACLPVPDPSSPLVHPRRAVRLAHKPLLLNQSRRRRIVPETATALARFRPCGPITGPARSARRGTLRPPHASRSRWSESDHGRRTPPGP